MSYQFQADTKQRMINQELQEAGVQAAVTCRHVMSDPWRYRHTAAIAMGWEAGFRPRGRRGIVEIHDCPISHPVIGALADQLNVILRQGDVPNYHGKVWLDCTVVGTQSDPAVQAVIQGIEGLTLETNPELPAVAEKIGSLQGVSSVAFRHRSGDVRALSGPLMSTIEVAGKAMWLPAGSFFQTNLEMLEVILGLMRENLQEHSVQAAADIYGGVGTLGLPLAEHVAQMTLVELDPVAVEAAERTARDWGISSMSFVKQHAERAISDLPELDLAIVDPPRSGLGEVVASALIANRVPLVYYVSCAPASLARDLAALEAGGFAVRELHMLDFYPQTYHVELLTVLKRFNSEVEETEPVQQ
jgi:23S rRNA (uracil1939-C5)-methyltransferase